MRVGFGVWLLLICCVSSGVVGCKGPASKWTLSRNSSGTAAAPDAEFEGSSIKTVSSSSNQPVTFMDDTSLQYGTGKIDPNAPTQFTMTPSGLRYRVLRDSTRRKPTAFSNVTVNYRGWLDNGTEFDSSYDRGEPTSFPLNGVIKGWTEGMQLVGEGGMIELWVPAGLGYGRDGSPPAVPPNATLHFIVELLSVR